MENDLTALPDVPGGGTEGVEILGTQNDALPPAAAVQRYENTGDGTQVVNLNGDLSVHNHYEFPPELLKACVEQLGIQMSKMTQPTADGQSQNTAIPTPSHAIEWASLSSDVFCLFVLQNEDYSGCSFSMAISRSLEKYTREEYKKRFKKLDPDAIEAIKQMPCIFAKKNKTFKSTVFDHPAVLGRITEIDKQDETIKFKFDAYQPFYQSVINDNIDAFMLASAPLRNELDVEHWSIRKGNLKEIIRAFGIEVK